MKTREEIIKEFRKDMGVKDSYILSADENYFIDKLVEAYSLVKESGSLPCVSHWAAVDERLPDSGTFCLTHGEYGHTLQYYKGHWETEYPVMEGKVTHWQEAKPPC